MFSEVSHQNSIFSTFMTSLLLSGCLRIKFRNCLFFSTLFSNFSHDVLHSKEHYFACFLYCLLLNQAKVRCAFYSLKPNIHLVKNSSLVWYFHRKCETESFSSYCCFADIFLRKFKCLQLCQMNAIPIVNQSNVNEVSLGEQNLS